MNSNAAHLIQKSLLDLNLLLGSHYENQYFLYNIVKKKSLVTWMEDKEFYYAKLLPPIAMAVKSCMH